MAATATDRLFFALWPDAALRADLAAAAAVAPVLGAHAGRPVAAADWHVTLCFLGSVDAARRAALAAGAAQITADACTLQFERLEYWHEARVIAVIAPQVPAPVLALAAQLHALARSVDLAPDERPLRPHLTLVRAVAPQAWSALRAGLAGEPQVYQRLTAREFHLAGSGALDRSDATAPASRYVSLARWTLRA